MPDNAFDRQNERISLAKKRVADAKKLYPWNHPVVLRLAQKRDQLIQDLAEMESQWRAKQPRPAARPSVRPIPSKPSTPGSSFLPKDFDPNRSGFNPSDWVKVPNPMADIETRLNNPERFGGKKPNSNPQPVSSLGRPLQRNGLYFETPEGKFVSESMVAGQKRVIGFDHEPTQKEITTARIKLLKQDHPDLYSEFQKLRKSYSLARQQAAMVGSLIDEQALNSQDYETGQLSNQALIPGNIAENR
jgi:hypothetical protein